VNLWAVAKDATVKSSAVKIELELGLRLGSRTVGNASPDLSHSPLLVQSLANIRITQYRNESDTSYFLRVREEPSAL
jgi:hypothetical protein